MDAMYVKATKDETSTLIQVNGDDLSYGRFVTRQPFFKVMEDTPIADANHITNLLDDDAEPDGHYGVKDKVAWWSYKYAIWMDPESEFVRAVVADNNHELYIMGPNGKTIDRA